MALRHYFWDSCVFIAFLNNDTVAYDVASLKTFITELGDTKNGCRIYASAVSLAEITPKRLKNSSYGSFEDFLRDFKSTIQLVDAGPMEMQTAGLLKDIPYQKNSETKRVLTTGDAIVLATAIELEDTYGISLDAVHTFDKGKSKGNPEGKGVPMIGYNEWFDGVENNEIADRVRKLNICEPIHVQPDFDIL